MKFSSRKLVIVMLSLLLVQAACTDYWWERGQAPGVGDLMARSEARLEEARVQRKSERSELLEPSRELEVSLKAAVSALKTDGSLDKVAVELEKSRAIFLTLEPLLSVGSRAAYGELAGQLRVFLEQAKSGGRIEYAGFGTFSARTLSFLAAELHAPKPTFG